MPTWGKGMVWVNGHALGRFWEIGPQQTLYMPGCWLKEGENEIIILDLLSPDKASIKGITKPILDKSNVKKKEINNSYNIDEAPLFYSGKFANRNGWQNIEFPKNMNTRYFALKINSARNGSAAIAEIEITDNSGENIPRNDWRIKYCSSEDTETGNHTADKIYDLQESTFWQASKNDYTSNHITDFMPYYIIIDLGKVYDISGFKMLHRFEKEQQGIIENFDILFPLNSIIA